MLIKFLQVTAHILSVAVFAERRCIDVDSGMRIWHVKFFFHTQHVKKCEKSEKVWKMWKSVKKSVNPQKKSKMHFSWN
jgi:hypothetical protein